MLQNTVAAQ